LGSNEKDPKDLSDDFGIPAKILIREFLDAIFVAKSRAARLLVATMMVLKPIPQVKSRTFSLISLLFYQSMDLTMYKPPLH
jgi:hypothetical protein